jgi:NADH:ubiquinone oxidoreductase subunit 2 (subunit N)
MRPAPGPSVLGRGAVPVIAGGSPEADSVVGSEFELTAVAVLFAAATIVLGIVPQPLFDLAHHAASTVAGAL